jgi:hypothetical protein
MRCVQGLGGARTSLGEGLGERGLLRDALDGQLDVRERQAAHGHDAAHHTRGVYQHLQHRHAPATRSGGVGGGIAGSCGARRMRAVERRLAIPRHTDRLHFSSRPLPPAQRNPAKKAPDWAFLWRATERPPASGDVCPVTCCRAQSLGVVRLAVGDRLRVCSGRRRV